MSLGRHRERKHSENNRLLRALSQPTQAWEKKWAPTTRFENIQTYKWVKSDRTIVYDDDDDDGDNVSMTETEKEASATPAQSTSSATASSALPPSLPLESRSHPHTTAEALAKIAPGVAESDGKPDDDDPDRTHTPVLGEVSDAESGNENLLVDKDDEDDAANDMLDPARNPAFNPHVHPHLTDDSMTDSQGATPADSTEYTTSVRQMEVDTVPADATTTATAPSAPATQEEA
ncbi:uncharacterized protein BYT42DRAFT_582911 [Radiomyces spectabilis]|uniref:uncharacterized protein n=1 Tax=Radiomyces spectabilis TaxID=64574 RepID=UPI00221FB866|nr:uncharacterized protein BYT42DRAFT_582911 [Radiomyces spectabilis]KAI8370575.1 hypothetical protein BYT42DRAFT_582911 [Radiomyces spectabilis]